MTADREFIKKLEKLAEIELTDAQREEMAGELDKILELMSSIGGLDADSADTETVIKEPCALRDDVAVEAADSEDILNGSGESDGGYFSVPTTVE